MPPVPARSPAVLASPHDCGTAFHAPIAHPLENSSRPTDGQRALGEFPAGVIGATTISAPSAGISGSTQAPFDGRLRVLCDDLVARFGGSGGPRLTWEAAAEALPLGTMTTLARIVELLVTNAFVHRFPPGRGGRIAVAFTAGRAAWQLTVDDSGIAVRSRGHLRIARQLVLRLGGRLEIPRVTGGTRCVVTLPRPRA